LKNKWIEMKYDTKLESWFVNQGTRSFVMHCGESFTLKIKQNEGIGCRLELGSKWYIILGPEGVRLDLNPYQVYQIQF